MDGLGAYPVVIGWLEGIGVSSWLAEVIYRVGIAVLVLNLILVLALVLVYMLRKVMGHMQLRLGPTVIGPFGLLQTMADAIKLMLKEDIAPARADRIIYNLAPYVIFFSVGMLFMVIPFSPTWIVNDLDVGVVFYAAASSLAALGFMMAGWGSNGKYSLIGGMRTVAQVVSYEVPMAMALLGVVILAGTLSTQEIVLAQKGLWFIILQPIGFVIFFLTGLAETAQTPFDLPEGESELVAGYMTEYSGMRFALIMLAEFANGFAMAAIITTLFLGGWHGPVFTFLPWLWPFVWFLAKTMAVVFGMMWVRSTWLRFRIDQVMDFAWKILVPLALINIMISMGEVLIIHRIGG